jgi:hypothetical protein
VYGVPVSLSWAVAGDIVGVASTNGGRVFSRRTFACLEVWDCGCAGRAEPPLVPRGKLRWLRKEPIQKVPDFPYRREPVCDRKPIRERMMSIMRLSNKGLTWTNREPDLLLALIYRNYNNNNNNKSFLS